MLFAQDFVEPVSSAASVWMMVALLVPAIFLAVVVFVLVIVFRFVWFSREKRHEERLKMIEAGYPLEEPGATQQQHKYMHNAFWISFWLAFPVPAAAFWSAASATDRVENSAYLIVIWIGASLASIASVICAAVLMIHSRSYGENEEDLSVPVKPMKPLDH